LDAQNGKQQATITDQPDYSFEFKKEHIPNINIGAVIFNGRNYTKTSIAWEMLESKMVPPEYLRKGLLKYLLLLFTRKPRNSPKNKNSNICLGLGTKGTAWEFNSGIKKINKYNPHFNLYDDMIKMKNIRVWTNIISG